MFYSGKDKIDIATKYSQALKKIFYFAREEKEGNGPEADAFYQDVEDCFLKWETMLQSGLAKKGNFCFYSEQRPVLNQSEQRPVLNQLDFLILFSKELDPSALVEFEGFRFEDSFRFNDFINHFPHDTVFDAVYDKTPSLISKRGKKYLYRHFGSKRNSTLKKPFVSKSFRKCSFTNFGREFGSRIVSLKNCKFCNCSFLGVTELSQKKIENVDFEGSCFSRMNFKESKIKDTSFKNCEITGNFNGAKFLDTGSAEILTHRTLRGQTGKSFIDFSGVAGIESNSERLARLGFEFDENGNLICYKAVEYGTESEELIPPIHENSSKYSFFLSSKEEVYLEENVDYCIVSDCSYGINVGTLEYTVSMCVNGFSRCRIIFECRIKPQDFFDTVVPLARGKRQGKRQGKIRAKRVYIKSPLYIIQGQNKIKAIKKSFQIEITKMIKNQTKPQRKNN